MNIVDFGAVIGDAGGANAAANDAAFMAAMASPHKRIEMPDGVIEIGQTISITKNAKQFEGVDGNDAFGTASEGTVLRWRGSIGGIMVSLAPNVAGQDVIAPGLSGVQLDGRGVAGIGAMVAAARRPKLINVQAVGVTSIGMYFSAKALGTANINCTYRGEFGNLSACVSGSATGIMLDGVSGAGGGNTTFCDIMGAHVVHKNGVAFYLRSCDDCHFYNAATSREVGGAGTAVLFDGNASYVVGNFFWGLQCGVSDGVPSIYSRGAKARQNRIYGLSGVDSQPVITIDTGSELYYDYVGGGYTATLAAEKAIDRVPKQLIRNY